MHISDATDQQPLNTNEGCKDADDHNGLEYRNLEKKNVEGLSAYVHLRDAPITLFVRTNRSTNTYCQFWVPVLNPDNNRSEASFYSCS